MTADQLTRREREIVEALGRGLSDKDIAREIGVSVETLRTHIRNAKRSLGASTRSQLVAIIFRRRRAP